MKYEFSYINFKNVNSKDRGASGWQKIDKELVDLEELQVKDYFNQL